MLLGACGQNGRSPTTTKPRGIAVTDQRGKTLVFDEPVKRILTIPKPAASMVIAVDQGAQHLVGMNEASWTAMRDGILGVMFPDALSIPHNVADQDFAPNVESVLKLKPDVVVQWANLGDAVLNPMEDAGLKVVGVQYGSQADVDKWLTLFATMLGKPERAQKMIMGSNAQQHEIKGLVGRSESKPPKILDFFHFKHDLVAYTVDSYSDYFMKLVGAENAAREITNKEGIAGVDIEQVLEWDPDVVLLGNFDASVPDDMYNNKIWKNLSAVRSRRVYKVPLGGYRWDPPSHESPLMWEWLLHIAFPGVDSRSLRKQIVDDYKFFYNFDVTEAQIDKILWTKVNNQSANYDQFAAT